MNIWYIFDLCACCCCFRDIAALSSPQAGYEVGESPLRSHRHSWRQQIFLRVATPQKSTELNGRPEYLTHSIFVLPKKTKYWHTPSTDYFYSTYVFCFSYFNQLVSFARSSKFHKTEAPQRPQTVLSGEKREYLSKVEDRCAVGCQSGNQFCTVWFDASGTLCQWQGAILPVASQPVRVNVIGYLKHHHRKVDTLQIISFKCYLYGPDRSPICKIV